MSIVRMDKLLCKACEAGKGVGAFNVGNMEMVMGVVKAAETLQTPVIMQIAEGRLRHSPLELMAPMMVQAAVEAKVDIAVHLDHGKSMDIIRKALDFGFSSVMFDGSALPLKENIMKTAAVADLAAQYDAATEGELGLVGGREGSGASQEICCTDPDEAELFCVETGIDALAVAIGNAHGEYHGKPQLRFDTLKEISRKVKIPLVLHGGSGISDEDFQKAIDNGIRKINIATASFKSLTLGAAGYLEGIDRPDYFKLSENMVLGVYENVKHHIEVFTF